jgi:hypothetical protein
VRFSERKREAFFNLLRGDYVIRGVFFCLRCTFLPFLPNACAKCLSRLPEVGTYQHGLSVYGWAMLGSAEPCRVVPCPISIFMQLWIRASNDGSESSDSRSSTTALLLVKFRFVLVSVFLPRNLILTLSRF